MLHTIRRCSTYPWFAETNNGDIVFWRQSFQHFWSGAAPSFCHTSLFAISPQLLPHQRRCGEHKGKNPNLVKLSCHSSPCCHPVLTPGVNPAHKQHSRFTFLPKFPESRATFIWLSQLQILIMCNYTPRSLSACHPTSQGCRWYSCLPIYPSIISSPRLRSPRLTPQCRRRPRNPVEATYGSPASCSLSLLRKLKSDG